ncbi:hypothetical protein [Streptomyces sp. S584]|uniref:hypothetical protein n=1 Tax=Streptomyces sp. S584 TaxID=3096010 RepID=UPI002AFF1BCA|nr:hypothetical protein [Streptomyces sp. S584]
MGYTIPEGVDTMLDVVGVGWPHVDEDAYRDMADSLREFGDDADDDAYAAYQHIQKLLASVDKQGETIEDSVTPVYRTNDPTDVLPIGLTIEARGNKSFSFTPYEGGSNTNTVTILNVPKRV